jgi:hypothetical protein
LEQRVLNVVPRAIFQVYQWRKRGHLEFAAEVFGNSSAVRYDQRFHARGHEQHFIVCGSRRSCPNLEVL